MTAPRQDELIALFTRAVIAAQADPDYADQVRDALAQSGAASLSCTAEHLQRMMQG